VHKLYQFAPKPRFYPRHIFMFTRHVCRADGLKEALSPNQRFKFEKIKILIADDQALMRDGLKTILELEKDMEVVGTAGHGREET